MTKKNAHKKAARTLQEKYGGKYQNHLRGVGGGQGNGVPPPVAPPPTIEPSPTGEFVTLTFTCLVCRAQQDLPLRDFASGRIVCPKHDPPMRFDIPNNGRYRRLTLEIDALRGRLNGVTLGLIANNTEPYLVLQASSRVELAHVDTFATKLVAVGHWNSSGHALSWERPMNGNLAAAVLMWLERNQRTAA